MLERIFSNDLPRSRILVVLLLLIVAVLAAGPFLLPGAKAINVAAKILIFVVLVASYDLLIGYTGIVSFAHTVFFGMGAYGVAISVNRFGPDWSSVGIGLLAALGISIVLAFVVGIFSLRVRAIFYAMITLALAVAFQTLATQLPEVTGGEDGITYPLPRELMPSFKPFEGTVFGTVVDGRVLCYYLLFVMAVVLVLTVLRIVNSPFGRVLQAVRENEFRAEAIGYRVVVYRILSNVLSAAIACVAGAMLALWLRYVGPDAALSSEIMLDLLLIVTIGGIGTVYGAVIGSALFLFTQGYLQDLLKLGSEAAVAWPLLSNLLSPDRWLLWLGVLFVLSVYYFPSGVVGLLRDFALRKPVQAGEVPAQPKPH